MRLLYLFWLTAIFSGLSIESLHAQVRKAFELNRTAYDLARTYPDSSIHLANEGLRVATQAGSVSEQARAHAVLGRTAIFKSDLLGLDKHVREGLPFALHAGNDTLLSDLYNLSSLNYRFRHKADSALMALGQAELFARKGKMTTQLSNALLAKGAMLSDKRQYARALAAYQECYRIDVAKGDEVGQAVDLQNIGLTFSYLRQNASALKAYRQALPLQRKADDKHGMIRTLISISSIHALDNTFDSSDRYLSEAYPMAIEQGDLMAQGAIANNLSTYAEARGMVEQTRSWARRSIQHYYATGDSARAASAMGNLGEAERKQGHLPEAQALLEKSTAYSRELGETKVLSANLKMLSLVYQAQGKPNKAVPLLLEYGALQDSLYKQNLAEEVASLEARHEAFLKDQQISLLNRNLDVQRLSLREKDLLVERRTLLAGLIALGLLGVAGILYFSAKRRRLRVEAAHQRRLREEQAQSYLAALAAEEAERKRIARELHDGLGQMLASVRLHMAARSGPDRAFADLEEMLAESSDEVRFISHNLMPQALERKGLDPAVEEFCERIARTKKLNIISHLEPVSYLLSPSASLMLYRVLQELVSNTLKHAGATELYITLVPEDHAVILTVEDNGRGFDLQTGLQKEGIGLGNLRERIAQAGAQLDIESSLGNGALFVVHLPVPPAQNQTATVSAQEEVSRV